MKPTIDVNSLILDRAVRQEMHVKSALAIARKHRTESQAWDDVCVLLEEVVLAE